MLQRPRPNQGGADDPSRDHASEGAAWQDADPSEPGGRSIVATGTGRIEATDPSIGTHRRSRRRRVWAGSDTTAPRVPCRTRGVQIALIRRRGKSARLRQPTLFRGPTLRHPSIRSVVPTLAAQVLVIAVTSGCGDLPPDETIDLGDGNSIRMILVSEGQFLMGSPEGQGFPDERPQRVVIIREPYYLGQTEVTQAQWQAVMGSNPSSFQGELNRPIERVSWHDAVAFCRRLSEMTGLTFDLPSEAEWEFACRAGTESPYSFGSDSTRLGDYAWFDENSDMAPQPVALKTPNAWGFHDMHGNVWEWCKDVYAHDSYSVEEPASIDNDDPSSNRLLRGGGWDSNAGSARSATRYSSQPHHTVGGRFGFRVVRRP